MKLESPQLSATLVKLGRQLSRIRVLLFILLVASLYGYMVFQIGQAINVEPTPADELTTVKASPRIDQDTVQQLKQLQDNSVSVKALFNDSRSNPFQ